MARNKKRKKSGSKRDKPKLSPKKYIQRYARKLPVKKTLVSSNIFDAGLGYVVVVREKKGGALVVGFYLVDVFACGVKDSLYLIVTEDELDDYLEAKQFDGFKFDEQDPNYTFNLVYGAVEYAEDIGIPPHKSFALTSLILDDVEEIDYVDIEFGKDGKPHYIPGINENPNRILSILNKNLGEGNYGYLIGDDYEEDDFYIMEVIKSISDKGKIRYLFYSSVARKIIEYVEGDISALKNMYFNNLDLLLENIKMSIQNDSDPVINGFADIIDELYYVVFAVIESIILSDGIDFLEDEYFISGFNDIEKMNAREEDSFTLYNSFGLNRLIYIYSFIAKYLKDWSESSTFGYDNEMSAFDIYYDFLAGEITPDVPFAILEKLVLLKEYEERFTMITEEMVEEIKLMLNEENQ